MSWICKIQLTASLCTVVAYAYLKFETTKIGLWSRLQITEREICFKNDNWATTERSSLIAKQVDEMHLLNKLGEDISVSNQADEQSQPRKDKLILNGLGLVH